MAITYQSMTGLIQRVGGTNVSISYPASLASGDLILALTWGTSGPYNLGSSYGFTQLGSNSQVQGGSTRECEFWYKVSDGTESGSISVSGPNNSWSIAMLRYSNATGVWELASSSNDASTATSHSIAGNVDPGINSGDHVICIATCGTDTNSANAGGASAQTLSASGCTFTNEIEIADALNTTGGDHYSVGSRHECDSGPSSGVPTYSFTLVNTQLATMFMGRIREGAASAFTPRLALTGVGY